MSDPLETPLVQTLGDIPVSLAELFNRDPLSLSRQDLNAIVETLRAQRTAFVQAESVAKKDGKRVNAKAAVKGAKVAVDMSKLLGDL